MVLPMNSVLFQSELVAKDNNLHLQFCTRLTLPPSVIMFEEIWIVQASCRTSHFDILIIRSDEQEMASLLEASVRHMSCREWEINPKNILENSMDLDKCIMMCIHHDGIIQCLFTAPNPLCSTYSSLPPPQPPETADLFIVSMVLPFQECHIQQSPFYAWFHFPCFQLSQSTVA